MGPDVLIVLAMSGLVFGWWMYSMLEHLMPTPPARATARVVRRTPGDIR